MTQAIAVATAVGNGPAFSAYTSGSQVISSSTWTKVQCATEEFDTNSNYDTTNYRFTPTVSGYYWFNGQVDNLSGSPSRVTLAFYKNGSVGKYSTDLGLSSGNFSGAAGPSGSALIYCNGSTDYVEFYLNYGGGGTIASGAGNQCYFQGFLARAA
jgi:hypothetical protein